MKRGFGSWTVLLLIFLAIAVRANEAAVIGECKANNDVLKVAVAAATGQQGRELIERFQIMNEQADARCQQQSGDVDDGGTDDQIKGKKFTVVGLTRDVLSSRSKQLDQMDHVTMVQTNYTSVEELSHQLLSHNVDVIYVNYAMGPTEAEAEQVIIDAAIKAKVQHILYASTISCDKDHGVPHWQISHQTEEYLKKRHSESHEHTFIYHFLRLGHFNENFLPGSYNGPKNGYIYYSWQTDQKIHTASLRDVARAASKLFADPTLVESGSFVDAVAEYKSPREFAKAISLAVSDSPDEIQAKYGPWVFVKFGHWFGWEPKSIVTMGKFIDANYSQYSESFACLEDLPTLLGPDELAKEPLDTIEAFAMRHFSSKEMLQ